MADQPRKAVLGDHIAVKRKLVPPFVHRLGARFAQYSWTRQLVPEAVWLGLMIEQHGYEAAQRHCLELSRTVCRVTPEHGRPMFVRFSAFAALSEAEKAAVIGDLDAVSLAALRLSLAPLSEVAPEHPLAFLGSPEADAEQRKRLPHLLADFYDRNSRAAVLSMALGYELGLDQSKIHVAGHLLDGLANSFQVIGSYPHSAEAQRAAGMFRASASSLFIAMKVDGSGFEEDAPWVETFWDRIAGFGPCLHADTFEDEPVESDDSLEGIVFAFRNAVRSDLRARLAQWPLDLNAVEAYEVVAALLARQATLAMDFAASPAMWTPHTAPIVLRAIADVFISLAWIMRDPAPRARQFVEDGLGAIKLQIAHQQRAMESTADPAEQAQHQQMIDVWSEWLSAQRIEAFVEVNLGSWSGLNTRKMAEEAGFLDFYNYVYQPFSGVAHSNWAHVSMYNSVHCQNPAHRLHRGAAIAPAKADPYWLFLASKYLTKTFAHFDEVQGRDLPHSALDLVTEQFIQPDEEDHGCGG